MWHKVVVFFFVLGIVGCASKPIDLPSVVDNSNSRISAQLLSRGKLVLSQKIKTKHLKTSCRTLSRNFKVTLQKASQSTRFPMHASCKVINRHLVVYPRNFLPPGHYQIRIERSRAGRYFAGKPKVLVRYLNPDFASEADQVIAGATVVAPEAILEGQVNYSVGDRTDWYQIQGENKMVALTLLGDDRSRDINVSVYRTSANGVRPARIGKLRHGRAKRFQLGAGNLYVKVTSNRYAGASNFSILRKDAPITRVITIPVIDSYRVSDSTSMLLFETVKGMRVQDQLNVKGRKLTGEIISLGRCLVTSVGENQASCKLPRVPKVNIVELHAQARIQG